MSKPHIHAKSSVKRWGGKIEDYMPIHEFMDMTKAAFPSNIHRFLLHNSFSIKYILPRVFGNTIKNSDNKEVSVEEIGEQHVLEDYGMKFIPSLQDWAENIEWKDWMNNGNGCPNSNKKIVEARKEKAFTFNQPGVVNKEMKDYINKNKNSRFTNPFVSD